MQKPVPFSKEDADLADKIRKEKIIALINEKERLEENVLQLSNSIANNQKPINRIQEELGMIL